MKPVLIYGASGSLGKSIMEYLNKTGVDTIGISRFAADEKLFSLENPSLYDQILRQIEPCSVIFAQGVNVNDDIFSPTGLRETLEANICFIVENLSKLLELGVVRKGSSVVIISSIWQELSRPNKLSYSISKSALRGLVGSLVADLSSKGIRVNAVLPGPVDNQMTRSVLSSNAISRIESETPMNKLVQDFEVAQAVAWLISDVSSGVVGQFIRVDNGWTNVKLYP